MKTCPLCGKQYTEHSALSRADNKTEICPDCGTRQALVAAGIDEQKQELILQEIRKQQQKGEFCESIKRE